MAVFGRQKRQSRFYWAELGFMALGLLGLQPSLFTSLFSGLQSKPASYVDPNYTTAQPLDFYRDWAASQLVSILTNPHSGPVQTTNGWSPAPFNGSQVPSTSYGQPGYAAPQYSSAQSYGTPQYAAQNYPTPNYAASYTNPGQLNGPPHSYPQNFAQPNYAPQQQQPYAQPAYSQMQPSSNGAYSPTFSTAANPNNQSAYTAQSNAANPYARQNQATNANGYGAYSNVSQPAYQPNGSYSTGYGVPTANNANPYDNGVAAGTSPYAPQPGYSNPQSNTGVSSGTWQRYQAPTSSTYYR
ncbi:MAG: hypothetical protein NTU79_24485 [Planctomycetota bacterium]|nr:hypothetical protein [Planctomycetota bacterium]